jgi:hypothetical protein
MFVAVVAAGALSVPFAGVAGADPAPDNPGVPGQLGGQTPGNPYISGAAKVPNSNTPDAFGVPPGRAVSDQLAPGLNKP